MFAVYTIYNDNILNVMLQYVHKLTSKNHV